ncbi:tetratricopeptide repeat protein [Psychrobacter immobilis]|uniref:tetratricopeptide repeat protein n=2 Tax=Psychrobacter immobilis TaxID=498 RepID=UPI00191B024C|nr:tetratricopeptide repeat protein [Psychrobacter immobilis]
MEDFYRHKIECIRESSERFSYSESLNNYSYLIRAIIADNSLSLGEKRNLSSKCFLLIGDIYRLLGKNKKANCSYIAALTIRPDYYTPYYNLITYKKLFQCSYTWLNTNLLLYHTVSTALSTLEHEKTDKYLRLTDKHIQRFKICKARILLELNSNKAGYEFYNAYIVNPETKKGLLWLAYFNLWSQNFDQAIKKYNSLLEKHPNDSDAFNGLLRAYCEAGNYKKAYDIFLKNEGNIDVSSLVLRNMYFGIGDFKKGWIYAADNKTSKSLRNTKDLQYYSELEKLNPQQETLVLSIWGPGDEIRWSTVYNEVYLKLENFKITCDPRLLSLFQRSFPNINFVPCYRSVRGSINSENIDNFCKLPTKFLSTALDNHTYSLINKETQLITNLDILKNLRSNISDFSNSATLKAHPDLIEYWKKRLSLYSNKKLVGISWKSSLRSFTRDIHYLDVTQMEPIFKTENIVFINLQYGSYENDIVYVKNNYSVDIVNFPELDLMNDFENMATLLSCLDMIISPCNFIIELAGALEVQGIMFSNSNEVNWRIDGNRKDIWHPTISHIKADPIGNKSNLVFQIQEALKEN